MQAHASTGFAERVVSAEGPRKNSRIVVETPTTVMALMRFVSGVDIAFAMSWDVWKHGHPPIELYGTEGSLRVPDPNFFGGSVEVTERGGDWQLLDLSSKPYGKPNWRAPSWPASAPDRANYRCLGIADLASSVLNGTPHRATGALAAHGLEVMNAMLRAGADGGTDQDCLADRTTRAIVGRRGGDVLARSTPPEWERECDVSHTTTRHHERAGDLSGAVRRRRRAVQHFDAICGWAAGLGYKGVQIPTWDGACSTSRRRRPRRPIATRSRACRAAMAS